VITSGFGRGLDSLVAAIVVTVVAGTFEPWAVVTVANPVDDPLIAASPSIAVRAAAMSNAEASATTPNGVVGVDVGHVAGTSRLILTLSFLMPISGYLHWYVSELV
jgi:hypothetical protein